MKPGPQQAPERGDEGVRTVPSLSVLKGAEHQPAARTGAEQGSWSLKARALSLFHCWREGPGKGKEVGLEGELVTKNEVLEEEREDAKPR